MKCPYRTIKRTTPAPQDSGTRSLVVAHDFAECYGWDCPFYDTKLDNDTMDGQEVCKRAQIEEQNARKERK